ncbi:D-alanine--D-alanine ligase [Caldalkalibacillus mannanilyticus]|uniref:D-alanine--D-alanine ligase n=1 Tax=Caldalkalibacillus mannanilyticus TaxID=1418 RepID=UPI00046A607B|nr:D-alanine--D-alanine ligase [Caldalkalibacillus mannanilyticus]
MRKKRTLGVIYGGKSSEHEVSLRTAYSIMGAVDYDKFTILPLFIQLNGEWAKGELTTKQPESVESLRLRNQGEDVSLFQLTKEVDVFFPVIHGPFGEDGTLQGLLEMLDIPYVGSGVLGSSLGMDKVMMKKIFQSVALPQCTFLSYTRKQIMGSLAKIVEEIEGEIGYPNFVKPVNLGSSVGISKAKNREGLEEALQLAAKFDRKVIVEQFIEGSELEIGVLGNEELKTSVVGKILSVGEFYDYAAKYKNIGTELEIPAKVPEHVVSKIEEMAKKAFLVLECSGLSRVDFFWNEKTDQVYINEINTMPGFTPFSMYPLMFKEAGISYPALIEELIQLAQERYEEKKQNQIEAESLE